MRNSDIANVVASDNHLHNVDPALGANHVGINATKRHFQRSILGVTESAVVHHAVADGFDGEDRALGLGNRHVQVKFLTGEGARFAVERVGHPGSPLQAELQ